MIKASQRFLKNLFLLGLSFLVAVALSEFLIRIVAPQKTLYPRYVASDEYPIEFPRNAKMVESQGDEWKFVYTTNELARRGPYLPISNEYETTNVVVLGDSFTFGIGVADDDVYTRHMARVLGDEYSVINGGMSGWGIDSEIKWFYQFGKEYDPRYVVIQFTANDPTDFAGVTSIENGDFQFQPYRYSKPWWQSLLSDSRLIQKSHLYSLARDVHSRLTQGGGQGDDGGPADDRMDEQQRKYVRMLELFARKLQAAERELFFLSVTQHQGEDYIYNLDRFPIIDDAVRELESSGLLHFVDLPMGEMRQASGSPQGHQWGPEHHELVGRRVAERILALE